MPKKITEKQRLIAIRALALGQTAREASAAAGISTQASESILTEAQTIKKDIQTEFRAETEDRIKALAGNMLSVVETAISVLSKEKIESQSGAAIATTMGILVDKMQLLTGGATENVQITAGAKSDDFLQKLRDKSRRIESAKIIDTVIITQPEQANKSGKALENE